MTVRAQESVKVSAPDVKLNRAHCSLALVLTPAADSSRSTAS
jgi:hypothetical protein